jgi:molecular chaperone DnaK
MIREAEQFAQTDRERRERVEKRNRAETLANDAERQLKEVTLDFGSQFASGYRRRIEALAAELREAIKRDDERSIDRAQSDLQDALYELKREVRMQYADDEDDDFFGSIRRTFTGESDSDRYRDDRRDSYRESSRDSYRESSRDSYRDSYRDPYDAGGRSSRPQPRRAPLQNDWEDDDDDWF